MYLQKASKIAVDICYTLQPHCQKKYLRIAGSVRRKKTDVKDIEIVALPKLLTGEQNSLFGAILTSKTYHTGFVDAVKSLGTVIKGKPTEGKYVQIALWEGINLDLFLPDDFDFYRQLAIRTGSADYAAKVIAGGWRKKGWCGSDKGLRKISGCVETKDKDGKSKWKCIASGAELPPAWESEEAFFEWIGVEWVHPSKRIVNTYNLI